MNVDEVVQCCAESCYKSNEFCDSIQHTSAETSSQPHIAQE